MAEKGLVNVEHALRKAEGDLADLTGQLEDLKVRVAEASLDVDALRRVRNKLVHGTHPTESAMRPEASVGYGAPISSACLALFKEEQKPLRLGQVDQKLRAQGLKLSKNSAWMALKRLEQKKLIRKVDRGIYQLINGSQ